MPPDVARRFRTARELGSRRALSVATAMAPFVCQSMSLNLYLPRPHLPTILAHLLDAWRAGLKTALYYCHTGAAADARTHASVAAPLTVAESPDACPAECVSCAL